MRMLGIGIAGIVAIALMALPAQAVIVDFGFQSLPVGANLTAQAGWGCWNVGVTNGTAANTCANQAVAHPELSVDAHGTVVAGPNQLASPSGGDWASGANVLLPGAVGMTDPTDPSSSDGLDSGEITIQTQLTFAASASRNVMTTFSGAYHGANWQGGSEMKIDAFGNVKFSTFSTAVLGSVAELAGHRLQMDYTADMGTNTVTSLVVTDLDASGTTSAGWDGSETTYALSWAIANLTGNGATGTTHFGFHSCCNGESGHYTFGIIPEPGTLALLGFGGLSMLMRRRRRA